MGAGFHKKTPKQKKPLPYVALSTLTSEIPGDLGMVPGESTVSEDERADPICFPKLPYTPGGTDCYSLEINCNFQKTPGPI